MSAFRCVSTLLIACFLYQPFADEARFDPQDVLVMAHGLGVPHKPVDSYQRLDEFAVCAKLGRGTSSSQQPIRTVECRFTRCTLDSCCRYIHSHTFD